ncbi:L,D-transpeptidase family protein [Schleiferilactobacillus shenzhenensis]|uniref:L,D-TPase catalytic domain-containing protein n=1 Tax=Schleiferilactobacillus shenzhenensis LY-73 TaxID=1231336 RepID=U4TIC0_9LACO|nr:L,D-transpeptidase family protein [Schleiferilactobacillus shenzhenensis]ERL63909.1 hypothetical protein L248_1800 [Schleiferilactobacillus shenzhenensis LY-73]
MHIKKAAVIVGGLALIAVLGVYLGFALHYQDTMLPHTTFAGVSVGGMKVSDASAKIKSATLDKQYTLTDQGKTVSTFTGNAVGTFQDVGQDLAALQKQQNPWAWPIAAVGGEADAADNGNTHSLKLNQKKVQTFVDQTVAKLNQGRTQTTNASIAKKDGAFVITKETYGTALDKTKVDHLVTQMVSTGQSAADLKETYVKPTVTASSAKLQKDLADLKKLSAIKGTYSIAGDSVTIPQQLIKNSVYYQNGQVSVNPEVFTDYLAQLAAKYNTIDRKRTFKTTNSGTVTVPAGTFGWSIQQSNEAQALADTIKKGADFTRHPLVSGSGQSFTGDGVGKTYVEVSKAKQHEWVYIDGVLKISTDVVTGKPGQDTPSGAFFVWSKQRNATLKGLNDDGSKYASPVSYWMPIDYTGVGLHDSPWQTKYGGDWYKEHGSHGCVNTPPDVMAKVYSLVPAGTPVIVY